MTKPSKERFASYMDRRVKGVPARFALREVNFALREVKFPCKSPGEWSRYNNGSATLVYEEGEFSVSVTIRPDDMVDVAEFDYLGSIDSERKPRSILFKDSRRERLWFTPGNSYNSRRKWLQENGYSRSVSDSIARKEIREDMELFRNIQSFAVSASVFNRAGIMLSEECVYMHVDGSRTLSDEELWIDASDVVAEALFAANEKEKELRDYYNSRRAALAEEAEDRRLERIREARLRTDEE